MLTFKRNKIRERVDLDRMRCRKHWLQAYGACDCCSDPNCCGPYCVTAMTEINFLIHTI